MLDKVLNKNDVRDQNQQLNFKDRLQRDFEKQHRDLEAKIAKYTAHNAKLKEEIKATEVQIELEQEHIRNAEDKQFMLKSLNAEVASLEA